MLYVYGVVGLMWMVPWWLIAKDRLSVKYAEGVKADCKETFINIIIEEDAFLVLNERHFEFDLDVLPTTMWLQSGDRATQRRRI